MTNLRPSKKIIYLLIACLLALGLIVVAAEIPADFKFTDSLKKNSRNDKYSANPTGSQEFGASNNSGAFEQSLSADDDKDGLKNWEENLWGTDPKNSDTDEDGTKDGEEVVVGRNPLVKGPADKITTETGISFSGQASGQGRATIGEDLPETETFGRELFSKYLAAKQSGAVNEEALVGDLVQKYEFNQTAKQYTAKDITVIPRKDSNLTILKEYGNALGLVISQNLPKAGAETEFEIFKRAIQTNSPETLAKLDPIAARYERIVRGALGLKVPEEAVSAHLVFLNSFEAALADLRGMKKTFSDPIVGLWSINRYPEDIINIVSATQGLIEVFDSRSIVFTQSEYGYALVHAI